MTRIVSRLDASKPGWTDCKRTKLLINSPAPTSSTSASPTSTTTSAPRTRPARPTPTSPRLDSFSDSLRFSRDVSTAGTAPNASPVRSEAPSVNRSAAGFTPACPAASRFCGPSATSASTPQCASSSPVAPPAAASSRLSVSSWRMSRRRPAPSAARSAISLRRPAARVIWRFATLTHAMRSTDPTAPSRTRSAGLISPANCSRSGTTLTPHPLSTSGYCASSRAAMVSISLRARSTVTPGLRSAAADSERPRLAARCSSVSASGTHTSAGLPLREFSLMNHLKSGGMTPTTVTTSPSSVTALPTTSGAPPKRRCHSPWLMTATFARPSASSPGSSVRPSAGRAPSSRKRLGVAACAATSSGSRFHVAARTAR